MTGARVAAIVAGALVGLGIFALATGRTLTTPPPKQDPCPPPILDGSVPVSGP